MCYNSCKYFWFNPMTGDDGCRLPRGKVCLDDYVECSKCGETYYVDDLDVTGVCGDCIEDEE